MTTDDDGDDCDDDVGDDDAGDYDAAEFRLMKPSKVTTASSVVILVVTMIALFMNSVIDGRTPLKMSRAWCRRRVRVVAHGTRCSRS